MEIWKDIEGYEGFYQVSNYGRIKSLERKVFNGFGYRTIRERVLKTGISSHGYSIVNLGYKKSKTVHRLVAKHHLDNPKNYDVVCHKDNDPTNNNISNLYWGTQSMNMQQCSREGRSKNQFTK